MKLSTIMASVGISTATFAGAALADAASGPVGYGNYGRGMMWGGDQWGGFGMVLGPIFMILVMVGIVAAVIYIIRIYAPHAIGPINRPSEDRALAMLRERLAKGEIDTKEFEERKRMLLE
ncbi:hypothetical protein GALL_397620 [mine drainage metagenome]|uniref:SHOCT domain-containing protein n=1 Tax=mine drainage metagenome TaxID=410659 RepID=A0A1J5QRG2_9ZZZZ